jgi:hypothetical protein
MEALAPAASDLASPKSMSFTSPVLVRIMLEGLMWRWLGLKVVGTDEMTMGRPMIRPHIEPMTRLRASVLFLAVPLAGCGGIVTAAADAAPDAAAETTPTPPPTTTTPAPVDASPPPIEDALGSLEATLPVEGCGARPWGCPGTGAATELLEAWLRPMVTECQDPARKSCGSLTVHFSRMPVPACADHLTFTEPPMATFVACMTKHLSIERCIAGVFVAGDRYTIALCP